MLCLSTCAWLTAAFLSLPAQTSASDPRQLRSTILDRQAKDQQAAFDTRQETSSESADSTFQFLSNKTQQYRVESLPEVNFDIGELYAGSVPIKQSDPNRTLFFVYKPSTGATPSKDLTIWLNGGPGCSSLGGFFQENGPILWQPGTAAPTQNPFAWSNLTNMLWVDQPVGAGFATGNPTARNEIDIAKDFVDFFKNFEEIFGIENYKIYVTGESYAGRYVPYISAEMLDQDNKKYFDLSGMLVYDPIIGSQKDQSQNIPAYTFAAENAQILGINETYLSFLKKLDTKCKYVQYMDKYLIYPPPGPQPNKVKYCDTYFELMAAVYESNPCFNVYHITDFCPTLSDPLGGVAPTPGVTRYFNRPDVKKAIHAPMDVQWSLCGETNVFPHGDHSPDPIQSVLPRVIEATNRTLVGNGDLDALVFTNWTLLSLQNMTWHGHLGFQNGDFSPLFVDLPVENPTVVSGGPQGTVGTYHEERGLLFVTTSLSGHMQPQYQPRATLKHLQWLLGMIETSGLAPPS